MCMLVIVPLILLFPQAKRSLFRQFYLCLKYFEACLESANLGGMG